MFKGTVSKELWDVLYSLSQIPELESFRLVEGTALALQMGHRISVDIDLFSNELTDKKRIRSKINETFGSIVLKSTSYSLSGTINGVRVDIYDQWTLPFRKPALIESGIKIAALEDIAAFKLSAITNRRDKKDYIDLFFLFKKLEITEVLNDFKNYEPLLSSQSVIFALAEAYAAESNQSVMPNMLVDIDWGIIKQTMTDASKAFIEIASSRKKNNS